MLKQKKGEHGQIVFVDHIADLPRLCRKIVEILGKAPEINHLLIVMEMHRSSSEQGVERRLNQMLILLDTLDDTPDERKVDVHMLSCTTLMFLELKRKYRHKFGEMV